jgi:hypothetical protein
MCPLLALALPRVFLQQPLTVLTRQSRQAVINQSIFNGANEQINAVLKSHKVCNKITKLNSITVSIFWVIIDIKLKL